MRCDAHYMVMRDSSRCAHGNLVQLESFSGRAKVLAFEAAPVGMCEIVAMGSLRWDR